MRSARPIPVPTDRPPVLRQIVLSFLLATILGLAGSSGRLTGEFTVPGRADLQKSATALLVHGVETEQVVRKSPTPWTPLPAPTHVRVARSQPEFAVLAWREAGAARRPIFVDGIGRGRAPPFPGA